MGNEGQFPRKEGLPIKFMRLQRAAKIKGSQMIKKTNDIELAFHHFEMMEPPTEINKLKPNPKIPA